MLSPTFCVLPWYSLEITDNEKTACCLLSADHDLDLVKKDLLRGVQTPACQKCWNIEKQNQDSRRIQENRFLDWKLDRDIEKIQEDCRQGKNTHLVYQLCLSNLCNQACVTCGSGSSTKWAEIERKMTIEPRSTYTVDVDALAVDWKNAHRISILGGEPMFDPRSFQLLEKLLAHNNTSCFISFVTNGSVRLNNRQLDLLQSFDNVNICFSVDGIGKRFEYMRWPGRWHTLLENLDQYSRITENVSISYTVSAINAIYHDETMTWLQDQGLRHNHNVVYGPRWASLDHAPVELKARFQGHHFLGQFAAINGQEIELADFKNQLQAQDLAKNIRLQDYLPELHSIITGSQ
jgi:organic radical activating enzyme